MNIAIVCYPTFGGSGVLATELGKVLADKGHNIHFITYQQPVRLSGFHTNIFYHEVRVPTYPLFDFPPYETALASAMVDVVLNNQIDLLHVHYAIPHASAAYMAKQILAKRDVHIPVITTLHGTDITLVGRDETYSPVVTFSMEESDVLTAVSENLKAETYRYFNISKPIEVIYNFVDVARFNKKPVDAFKKLIAPGGEKIIVHASNFRKVKRVDDVVKTFLLLRKKIPAKLLLIGDGPERPHIESMTRHCEDCADIKFLGKQEQMEDILPIADLFLLPSEYESFGLAALEAMAAEVPVISTNAGGLPEINVNGYSGYMSDIGDVEDMAANAVKVLENDETHRKFKKQALAQAKKFDIQHIIPTYEAMYTRLLETSTAS
ncbi:MAG TPA: N-acetyl-alpha-D-glucosaminyl L-malate synthase BshA [Ferruginibacter sp.]|nr:N-acetyl-alpha-D-glucosaminyl L-malate synthase BshA [Chitinophagaceae bacterium]HML57419.1 N-acetyl-alpha-D-glucosaminyl L-malate synthase BshA [Ferruginibacter sp.]HRN93052.1 N-acetyl-alpha-D-glucosaminyl L-malate synthase BshA [Ferruginibacter sp.]HRO05902.1 N-acetyl-alpha-D-glucosaminyl L-malate synthase BshA [Ferruginibacter sp.]HRO97621.1 N-acetyl-alpha-D-glucosaminyl L-malate synthase BshA [Ferruginibacter sp.]